MKSCILFALLYLAAVAAGAQKWENLNLQFQNLYSKGEYIKALPVAQEAVNTAKKEFGEFHSFYATSLNNLAIAYESIGRYETAEPLYIESMAIRKKVFGEHHPDYSQSLTNLALMFLSTGRYEKAEPLLSEALKIDKKVFGEFHANYASGLNNLGGLYNNMGQYEKAESLFAEAMKIDKKVLGEKHPYYASDLNNLAGVYASMSQYEKAEAMYKEAMSIRKKVLGEAHPNYAVSLNNLAFLYQSIGKYPEAESLYTEAMEIKKKVMGESHPSYVRSMENLAGLYENMGQYEKEQPLLINSSMIFINNLERNFTNLSDKEKQHYLDRNVSLSKSQNSLLYNYKKASPAAIQHIVNTQLFFKGLILQNTQKMIGHLQQSKDTGIQRVYKNWILNKNLLSKQYALPIDKRNADLKQTEENTEKLEKELNRLSADYNKYVNALRITMQDIQKKLEKNEVAIEFVKFQLYNKKTTDSTIYAAYILRKDDPIPRFIPLCEEKQLGKYFSSVAGASNIKTIYRSDPIDENEKPAISGDSLYTLIWKPLLPYLKDIKKIDYSPAGLMHKIAFHALPTGDSSMLMDTYELNQYTSLRQLAINEEKKVNNNSIALFGNCLFSMDSSTVVKNIPANENANTFITAKPDRSNNIGGWKQLEGTASEITSIKTLFNRQRLQVNTYEQEKATEEQFKSLSGSSPTILHLATHGFFLPDPEKKKQEGFEADKRNAFTLADDPLLRSGIVLSGANRVWSGQPPVAGREDGIVTAYEIAQLDLSKTDLVVLSACETALGDIRGNEGVFGLQRAFKLAGVKNMLLSLWKVPDAETAELMKIFYTYYMQGKTARESFTAAQKDMRQKYKPYYWAAFVLIE